jgi:hypothetical protein
MVESMSIRIINLSSVKETWYEHLGGENNIDSTIFLILSVCDGVINLLILLVPLYTILTKLGLHRKGI